MSRVLIICPGALGDLICLGPTIAAIARRHPNAEIELMARGELAEFAVGRLGISRGHSIDRREVAMLFREPDDDSRSCVRKFFAGFDRIYCFFNAEDAAFRRALSEACAPTEVTFHRFRPEGEGHVALGYIKEALGEPAVAPFAVNLLPTDLESASRLMEGIAEPEKFVAIFPGSGSPFKNWPVEKFSALADRLKMQTRIVFVLGPAEESIATLLCRPGHRVITDQPLGTVAAIARNSRAFIGNDSGVSHLAAATGTPGVVLFGPSDPIRWRPLGRVTILHRNPIDSIEIGEVAAAVDALSSSADS